MSNFQFSQSLDGLNNIEADTVNTSNLIVGSLIVDTAEITTLSNCNLVNCTSETPANNTSVVNKTYVDSNFCDLGTNQLVGGEKTFLGDMTTQNIRCSSALYFIDLGNASLAAKALWLIVETHPYIHQETGDIKGKEKYKPAMDLFRKAFGGIKFGKREDVMGA